ncbi:MAG: hypothetical protein LAT67_15110 [Balneolales bacterium]|nr:hypothetical protein [Balneolales bacterium]
MKSLFATVIISMLVFSGAVIASPDINSAASESEKTVLSIQIESSEVVMLDGKPLHVDFLSVVLMDRMITESFTVDLNIQPNAPMGVVSDTQTILNELGIEPTLVVDL